jgi:hypothetical protein
MLTNNWTCGAVTIDAANSNTNTFGGYLVKLGLRVQSGTGTASGANSHAEGAYTTASGANSHAEGAYTTASAENSHAENFGSTASGWYSHAEGGNTTASGIASHAEGFATVAGGNNSHAGGQNASATNHNTFVWSDGTFFGSSTSNEFSVYAANGIRLLGGPIEGNGSGLTNLPPDASKANSNSVVSVIQTNSAGVAVTNQFTIGNANPTIVLPTISAGGASTPWTNSIYFRVGSYRNATITDFNGGNITGSEVLDTASGTSIALFNTTAGAATNIYSGSMWFKFKWEADGTMTFFNIGFRKSGTTATNFPFTLGYSNLLTGAQASMVFTGICPLSDVTYRTNFNIASSICTQAVEGAGWFLRWDPTFGATVSTTQAYMGVEMEGVLYK